MFNDLFIQNFWYLSSVHISITLRKSISSHTSRLCDTMLHRETPHKNTDHARQHFSSSTPNSSLLPNTYLCTFSRHSFGEVCLNPPLIWVMLREFPPMTTSFWHKPFPLGFHCAAPPLQKYPLLLVFLAWAMFLPFSFRPHTE